MRIGQCHSGEIELYTSNTGGGDYLGFKSESGTSKCNRGNKAFCCTDNTFDDLTADCYWTGCSGSCKSDEVSVATAVDLNGIVFPLSWLRGI
jgi:chitinase